MGRHAAADRPTLVREGQMLDKFHLVRLLGRGGIGEVWEIKHKGKPFALKVIEVDPRFRTRG